MNSLFILISIIAITCFTIFLINLFVDYRIKKWISEIHSPVAKPTLKAILFIAFGLFVSELIETINILQAVLSNTSANVNLGDYIILRDVSMLGAFFSIILLLYIVIVAISAFMHKLLRLKSDNKMSLFASVANNEFYELVLFGAILLSLTLAVKTGIGPFLDHFIPYPEVSNF